MKVGLFLSTQGTAQDSPATVVSGIRAQVRAARDAGLSSVWLGAHLLTAPMTSVSPMVTIGALLAESGSMTIGTNVLPLPLYQPAIIAEDAATLQILSDGRFVLGVGIGYREAEFASVGVPRAQRVSRTVESIGAIRALFAGGTVRLEGDYYPLIDVGLGANLGDMAPPPIYMGGTVDAAIARAGDLADGVFLDIYHPAEDLARQAELFRVTAHHAGRPPGDVVVLRECFVGRDDDDAWQRAYQPLRAKYDAYHGWGQDAFLPQTAKFDQDLAAFGSDRFLIGSPENVRREFGAYVERCETSSFVVRCGWPGMPLEDTLGCIARVGDIVRAMNADADVAP
jgi:alkanesulfonate monooxygenase SsuD/methylene tetrahydromethanopterin reductase-like flavin-dependent oxidoreductase (luciferase family)